MTALSQFSFRTTGFGLSAILVGIAMILASLVASQGARAQGAEEPLVYRLDAGDKVKVRVFGEDNLSGEFEVDGSGNISMPLVGAVKAGGLTIDELQAEIVNQLQPRYLLNPNVSIEIVGARPFYILGQVKSPGAYPYEHNMTVPNAIALAGGYLPRANTGKVYIRRSGKGEERKYDPDDTTPVLPGDIIRVRERFF